jgi:hypothetical protein
MPPSPPVDVTTVLLTALFNPAVIAVALWMGRNADQIQKLPIAAFAASLAGWVAIYIGVRWLGLNTLLPVGRATAGVLTAQFLFGLVWAALAYRFFPRAGRR